MKHTLAKRLCLAAAAILLVGAFAFALAACDEKGGNTEEVTVSLILGDADAVSVTTDAPFLYDLLEEYCEENGLALEGSTSATGFYATRIGDLAEDAAAGEYIMFYTSTTSPSTPRATTSKGMARPISPPQSGCPLSLSATERPIS